MNSVLVSILEGLAMVNEDTQREHVGLEDVIEAYCGVKRSQDSSQSVA